MADRTRWTPRWFSRVGWGWLRKMPQSAGLALMCPFSKQQLMSPKGLFDRRVISGKEGEAPFDGVTSRPLTHQAVNEASE